MGPYNRLVREEEEKERFDQANPSVKKQEKLREIRQEVETQNM